MAKAQGVRPEMVQTKGFPNPAMARSRGGTGMEDKNYGQTPKMRQAKRGKGPRRNSPAGSKPGGKPGGNPRSTSPWVRFTPWGRLGGCLVPKGRLKNATNGHIDRQTWRGPKGVLCLRLIAEAKNI
jgi:hypothetical protein